MTRQDKKKRTLYNPFGLISIHDALFVIAALTFLLWEIYTCALARKITNNGLPDNYGNFQQNRVSIKTTSPDESFSFGVVGDTLSSATFHRICNKFNEHPLSFVVIVGDFADKCTKPYHDFFSYECSNAYNLSAPTFLIAGNRDVDYDNTYNNDITLANFNAMYGPANFAFEHAGCLFIGICNFPTPATSTEGVEFLEATLAKKRKENQRVFVFTHIPPLLEYLKPTMTKENCTRLLDAAAKHKVDYIIAGHLHGYSRIEHENTVHLATGGGGAALKETESFAGLHHAMVFTVNTDSVSEDVILVKEKKHTLSQIPRLSLVHLYPLLKKYTTISIVANLIIILLLLSLVAKYTSKIKGSPND